MLGHAHLVDCAMPIINIINVEIRLVFFFFFDRLMSK